MYIGTLTSCACVIASALLAGGCSTSLVTSSRLNPSDPANPQLTYYLPKVYVKATWIDEDVTLTVLPPVADQSQAFSIIPIHKKWRNDEFTFATDEQGLLEKVTVNSADQSGEIAAKFAEIIMAFHNPLLAAGGTENLFNTLEEPTTHVEVIFDPTNETDVRLAESALQVTIDASCLQGFQAQGSGIVGPQVDGIVYRREVPWRITVSRSNAFQKSTVVWLPTGPLSVLPLTAGGAVETKYTLDFTSGSLTKYDSTRPSEILGIVSIPGGLIRTFLTLGYQRRAYEQQVLQQRIEILTKESEYEAKKKPAEKSKEAEEKK